MTVELEIHPDDAGQRADRYLRKLLPRAPLSLVHRLLRQGALRLDGNRLKAADRLPEGGRVTLALPRERFDALRGTEDRPVRSVRLPELVVVHRDADLLIVDKPGGLAVHPGTGVGDDHLVARLRALTGRSGARTFEPAPAHRIDRGTSGLVVCGVSARGLRAATALFRERRVEKTYRTVVEGQLLEAEGVIDLPLEVRDAGAMRPKVRAAEGALPARTRYRVLRHAELASGAVTLLELRLDTGRTHQLRAHLSGLGHPIVGDVRYGARASGLTRGRFALHAARLRFASPFDAETTIDVTAPWPSDLQALAAMP